MRPLREFATPLIDLSGPTPFRAVQTVFDEDFPYGKLQYYWKSLYLRELNDAAIAAIEALAAARP